MIFLVATWLCYCHVWSIQMVHVERRVTISVYSVIITYASSWYSLGEISNYPSCTFSKEKDWVISRQYLFYFVLIIPYSNFLEILSKSPALLAIWLIFFSFYIPRFFFLLALYVTPVLTFTHKTVKMDCKVEAVAIS